MELFILQLVDFLTSIEAGFYSAINIADADREGSLLVINGSGNFNGIT